MQGAQARKDSRVLWDPKVQALKPFKGSMGVPHQVINGSNLQMQT